MIFRTAAAAAVLFAACAAPAQAQGFLDKLKNAAGAITSPGGSTSGGGADALATDEIIAGLREALKKGLDRLLVEPRALVGDADPDSVALAPGADGNDALLR